MYIFKHRPFMFGCFVSVLTLIASYCLPEYFSLLIFGAILCAFILVITVSKRRDLSFFGERSTEIYITVCIMAALMAVSYNAYMLFYISPMTDNFTSEDENISVFGYFTDEDEAIVYGFENTVMPYRVMIRTDADEPIMYHEFSFTGELLSVEQYYASDPQYYRSQNITAVCVGAVEPTGKQIYSLGRLFDIISGYAVECIQKYCPEQSGFVAGLVFGERELIPSSVYTDFKRTGTTHLCAVSGLHLIAVLAIADLFFAKVIPMRNFRYILTMLLCILYVCISGGSMSVIRAGAMYLMCRGTFFAQVKNDSLTSLAVVTYFSFLIAPYAIYDVGFVLSVASTLGLIVFGVPGDKAFRGYLMSHPISEVYMVRIQAISTSLIYSLACTVTVMPFLYIYYGGFCPWSPITTMILSVPMSVVLYIAPLCVIFSFNDVIAGFFGAITQAFAELCVLFIDFCADTFDLFISLKTPFTPFVVVTATAVLLIILIKKASRKDIVIYFVCISLLFTLCSGVFYLSRADIDNMTVISDGDGELVCIISDNRAIVCDSTDGDAYGAFTQVYGILAEAGITRIDYVITSCTGYHEKYISWVCCAIGIDVLYVCNPMPYEEKYITSVETVADENNISCIRYKAKTSTEISVGDTYVTMLPRIYDGVKHQTAYIIGNSEYIYCPMPIHRVSYTLSKYIKDSSVLIYGTRKHTKEYTFVPLSNAKTVYIPDALSEKGFTVEQSHTETVYRYANRFTVPLGGEE